MKRRTIKCDFDDVKLTLTVPRLYSNGVTDAVKDSELFDHIIDFQTLL